jgi:hypothetical protein
MNGIHFEPIAGPIRGLCHARQYQSVNEKRGHVYYSVVVTDGVLLNGLRDDPVLSGIDVIVFDE